MGKKSFSSNIVNSKGTIIKKEAKICKVKLCSVCALWDIVSFGVYCQCCVINHTTELHSQGLVWLIGLQLQNGLSDDLFSRWNAALHPHHLPGTEDGWLTPAASYSLRSSIPQANRLWGHIYKAAFRVTKWEEVRYSGINFPSFLRTQDLYW